jgi:gluconolactonase
MSGGSGPDGLAIDENDNLAVCHVGFGAVWLFSALGEPMLRINSPQRHPHHQRRLWRSRQHNYFKL